MENPDRVLSLDYVDARNASTVWSTMSTAIRKMDEVKIKGYKEDIDTLLVLAGLLSGVTASFLVDSYKSLQPNPDDLTNQLLAQIVAQLNGTVVPPPLPFQTPNWAIQVNILWIASLIFSVITASLGILVKQWLKEFLSANDVATSPQAQLRIRFFRHPALRSWKVLEFVAVLPMLLQLALGLFLLGLCFFSSAIHSSIRNTSVPLVSLWIVIFVLVTLAPAFSPRCPYKTTFLKAPMRSLRKSLSKWDIFRALYVNSAQGVDEIHVRNISLNQDATLRSVDDGDQLEIDLVHTQGQEPEGDKSGSTLFEEEDAALDDQADLNILFKVGANLHDERIISTLFIKSFLGSNPEPPDVIDFILRVLGNLRQNPVDVDDVSAIIDLRHLPFEVWSIIIQTVTAILKKEVDVQHNHDSELVKWTDWMEDAVTLLLSLASHPLPTEGVGLLSHLFTFDPLSTIAVVSSKLSLEEITFKLVHVHLLRSFRSVVSTFNSQERECHTNKLLRQRKFPGITEQQERWIEHVRWYLLESSVEEAGFPLLHTYHKVGPPVSRMMSLLVRLLTNQYHLKRQQRSQLNTIVDLRTLPADDWSVVVKIASATILFEFTGVEEQSMSSPHVLEFSHSVTSAFLVLLSPSKHGMPYEGLNALCKLLVTSTETCMNILLTKIQDNSMLDHVVLRLSNALQLSEDLQVLSVTQFLWSRYQRFKWYTVSDVDDTVETASPSARLMESLLRSRANDILCLFTAESRRLDNYTSHTMRFTYKLVSHVLQVPFSELGKGPVPDLSVMDVKAWQGLTSMLASLLEKEVQLSTQRSPYPPWVQDALRLALSLLTYQEPCPYEYRHWFKRFLDDTRNTDLVVDVIFPKTSVVSALYRNLCFAFELSSAENMLDCIGSLLSKRFCRCTVDQRHSSTLIEVLGAHAADITSIALEAVTKHLMAIVNNSFRSMFLTFHPAQSQVIASVLFSPQFSAAASSESAATRKSWLTDHLNLPDHIHALLHLLSADPGFGEPQLTTIVQITLNVIIDDGYVTLLHKLVRALGNHMVQCDASSPLNIPVICAFLADLCEAHVLYHLDHNPVTSTKEILRHWQYVWFSFAVAFNTSCSASHASKCLDRLQKLQTAMNAYAHRLYSDWIIPYHLILVLNNAAGVTSSIDDASVDFWHDSAIHSSSNSLDDIITDSDESLDSSDTTTTLPSRQSSSTTLPGTLNEDSLVASTSNPILYHAEEMLRSESSLGLSGLESDAPTDFKAQIPLPDSATPSIDLSSLYWHPSADVLPDN
ncbi:hypothetical protein QCA50_001042 [Cerrena zonata]|uniref:DUF6535 domain-containing protein n=1 Tax=Cerrena zonata TaxID=2478898 RepID=A0AAW0GS25_9APHY